MKKQGREEGGRAGKMLGWEGGKKDLPVVMLRGPRAIVKSIQQAVS